MTTAPPDFDPPSVVAETRAWVDLAVVGLNFCPFAAGPLAQGRVRWAPSAAATPEALLADLLDELDRLAAADPGDIETTLLIHPRTLTDFDAFNDFLDVADAAVVDRGLEGVVQIASFHPDYRFADSAADDLGNATNRAPYPVLQLLREASVERAVQAYPDAERHYETNLRTLDALGAPGWQALRAACRQRAGRPA